MYKLFALYDFYENRLNGLALLNVHRDIDLNIDSLIDIFTYRKERRLDFKL